MDQKGVEMIKRKRVRIFWVRTYLKLTWPPRLVFCKWGRDRALRLLFPGLKKFLELKW